MALYSQNYNPNKHNIGLTGTIVDSGDGVTHVIPIWGGTVIGS